MKFIHTADWHLGKVVYGIDMIDEQREVLKQFIELVRTEQPDAVIIAGDLYDRAIPSTQAIELLNEVLFEINVTLQIPIIAIAGNHDSAERISFGSGWYEKNELYLIGKFTEEISPITIKGVNFYAVPYAEPGVVRQAFQDETINSHEKAMKATISKIKEKMNFTEANVFVGHTFVVGGKESSSERTLSVGGTGAVSEDIFNCFSYTALGHLHSPDAITSDKIFYSGSLLKYSFSEVNQRKSISIVEMDCDGKFTITYHHLKPSKDMRTIEGTLAQLLDPDYYNNEKTDDYLNVILHDEGALIDPMNKLRQVYPNVLHLDRKQDLIDVEKRKVIKAIADKQKTELQLFEHFYNDMTTAEFNNNKRKVMESVIEEVRQEEGLK